MSTEYITKTDMHIESFFAAAKKLGYRKTGKISNGDITQLTNSNGDYVWVTPIGSRVLIIRHKWNSVFDLIKYFDLINDEDTKYWEYMGNEDQVDEQVGVLPQHFLVYKGWNVGYHIYIE